LKQSKVILVSHGSGTCTHGSSGDWSSDGEAGGATDQAAAGRTLFGAFTTGRQGESGNGGKNLNDAHSFALPLYAGFPAPCIC
jgi:hypothetical protein